MLAVVIIVVINFFKCFFLCKEKAGAIYSQPLQSAAWFQQHWGSLLLIRTSLEEKIEQLSSRRCLPLRARVFILLVLFQMNKFARQQ